MSTGEYKEEGPLKFELHKEKTNTQDPFMGGTKEQRKYLESKQMREAKMIYDTQIKDDGGDHEVARMNLFK